MFTLCVACFLSFSTYPLLQIPPLSSTALNLFLSSRRVFPLTRPTTMSSSRTLTFATTLLYNVSCGFTVATTCFTMMNASRR